MEPSYIVIDCETTINGGERGASPFSPENYAVLWGSKTDVSGVDVSVFAPDIPLTAIVVGHNLKFDACYYEALRRDRKFHATNVLWDTQLAEYLLSGQQVTFARLDELAEEYGGTLKDSRVSDMFKKGIGADKIDTAILTPYLIQDIENTERVFLAQVERAEKEGMMALILSQMAAYAATLEMSLNGLCIDDALLIEHTAFLGTQIEAWEKRIAVLVDEVGGVGTSNLVNTTSNQQLATLLFGGTLPVAVKEEIGVYKTGVRAGLPKFKNVIIQHTFPPRVSPASKKWKTETGAWKVDKAVLQEIIDTPRIRSGAVAQLLAGLLELSDLSKQHSTYYGGIERARYGVYIHPDFNHAVTKTGRLSSSNPNLQNITNGDIKKVFVSRFDGGQLVEFDYSQLEIIGLSIMSGDAQLHADLVSGTDIHIALYTDMYKRAPSKAERKAFKPLTFGLVYGAGANTLAINAKCSKETATKFVETFYNRYKGVKAWHEGFAKEVNALRKPSTFKDEAGYPVGAATYTYPLTGRKYVFREYPAPEWVARMGRTHTFSPTELKNYPVQGLSTGDIVPMMLGEVFLALQDHPVLRNSCLMVNTVHDSMLFDCKKEVVKEVVDFVRSLINNTPRFFFERFGSELPFKRMECGVSVGKSWFDQTEL